MSLTNTGHLLLWFSDLHLDRAGDEARNDFLARVAASDTDRILITGDISHADRLVNDLTLISEAAQCPVGFVLGNHDHFGASIATVRDAVVALSTERPAIQWLPPAGVTPLSDTTVMIGVDGWADGRFGDALHTPLALNDDRLIAELAGQKSRAGKLAVRRVLADADATRLSVLLGRAVASRATHIIVATHVPPFVEALRPGSRAAHADWYPLLVCGATGEVLRAFALSHPGIAVLVLAGHTHAPHQVQLLPNLEIRVAAARYGEPALWCAPVQFTW